MPHRFSVPTPSSHVLGYMGQPANHPTLLALVLAFPALSKLIQLVLLAAVSQQGAFALMFPWFSKDCLAFHTPHPTPLTSYLESPPVPS